LFAGRRRSGCVVPFDGAVPVSAVPLPRFPPLSPTEGTAVAPSAAAKQGGEVIKLSDDSTRVPETILEGTTCDSISDVLGGLERVSCVRPPSAVADGAVPKLSCTLSARHKSTVTVGTSDAPLAVTSSRRFSEVNHSGLEDVSGSPTPAPRDIMRPQRSWHSVATVGSLDKECPAWNGAWGRQAPLQKPDQSWCSSSVAPPIRFSSAFPGDNQCKGIDACTPPGVVQQPQPENASVASLMQPPFRPLGIGAVSRRQSFAGPRPIAHHLSRTPSLQHISLNPHTRPLHAQSWRISRDAAALAVAAAALEVSAIASWASHDLSPSSSGPRLVASGDAVSVGVGGYTARKTITQRDGQGGSTAGSGKAMVPITGRRASK